MSSRIKLPKKLRAFEEASTSSPSYGQLKAGIYDVLEIKNNFPSEETDYVQLRDQVYGNVWICKRWQEHVYALLLPDVIKFSGTDAIDEAVLLQNLEHYNGSVYSLNDPHYPFQLRGVTLPQAPPSQNNCCTFVEGIVVKSFQDVFQSLNWDMQQHNQMMIIGTTDIYAPVTEVVEAGLAVELDQDLPQPWTIMQVWNDRKNRGHTLLIVDHDPLTDRVLTLESNKFFGLNGVGFRGLGNADGYQNEVPEGWNTNPSVPTWNAMKNRYPNRKMAALKVKNLNWVNRS